jgi:hypothetical protein
MSTTVTYYINNPVSGTQYWAPLWNGVVSSGESLSVTATCYNGTNGGGGTRSVTSVTAILWDQTSNSQAGSFTFSGGFQATTSNGSTSGHYMKCSAKYSGSGVGSIKVVMTYSSSTAFTPTTPSFSPTSGTTGSSVTITGSRFTDATGVSFNGVGAAFTINSDTQITATVPGSATTGLVNVSNPAGNANSSSSFTVTVGGSTPSGHIYGGSSWATGAVKVNTGTPSTPVWTAPSAVQVNTGTPSSPVWTTAT